MKRDMPDVHKIGIVLAALFIIVPALALSIMSLAADRYATAADRTLDDPETEMWDIVDISEQSMPAYRDAIRMYDMARSFDPLNAGYARSLAGLYFRIAVWQESMNDMGVQVKKDPHLEIDLRGAAFLHARTAIRLDPSHADHNFVLAQLYARGGEREAAVRHLLNAVRSYPVNGEVRYTAAMQLLLFGMQEQAKEQAQMMAERDDSYRLDDDDPRSRTFREQRPSWYQKRLARSYLFKAFEILWRTSGRDVNAVLAAVPENDDARAAAQLFLDEKGIER